MHTIYSLYKLLVQVKNFRHFVQNENFLTTKNSRTYIPKTTAFLGAVFKFLDPSHIFFLKIMENLSVMSCSTQLISAR